MYHDGKKCAIPSLHRDSFLAKVPGPCPVLRRVTQPPHIAGPLGVTVNPTRILLLSILVYFDYKNGNSEDLDQAINAISKTISKEDLILILNIPDSIAIPTNCFSNVLSVQTNYGGKSKFGWTFFHRYSETNGDYVIVSHHAVWLSPSNFLVDVTPFHSEIKHQPITKDEKVLFLPDQT